MYKNLCLVVWLITCASVFVFGNADAAERPNVIFVMADDMGWGQTSYRNHPVLKTPNLDAMAASGLRFDRFYAGCPVCSPTRASVLTGRSNDRTGVLTHGYALRLQEKTIAQALQKAGYTTAHFGKWHLNGFKGPGAPVLASDSRSPSAFGFDKWLSVTNFFDVNPLLSRQGKIEEFEGDSSEIVVDEALKFINVQRTKENPFFAVIWFGTPHVPFRALPSDKAQFPQLNEASANHYGELVALDRSIGKLRQSLQDWGIADDTLFVFCSDNGGLPGIEPATVGGLRGNKSKLYEGGIRVPGIIEWPAKIKTARITNYPASTMDLFPTVAEIVGLPDDSMIAPVDGASILPLFESDLLTRAKPIPFRFGNQLALIDNRFKILTANVNQNKFELYDLEKDPNEQYELSQAEPKLFERMKTELLAWNASVDASFAGHDYPEKTVQPPDPPSRAWNEVDAYQPFLSEWKDRWEYKAVLTPKVQQKQRK